MATYKVSYFQGKGGGEILRLVFVAAGKNFEDERLSREDWLKVKNDSPTKQMPLLTVSEGGKQTVYGQSGACARYLAKKFGLFGNANNEILVDEAYECVMDVQREAVKLYFEKEEAAKTEIKKKLKEEVLKRLDDYLDTRASKNKYIVGNSLTLADLQLYNLVDQTDSMLDGMFSSFANIMKHADVVKSEPKIAAYRKKLEEEQAKK